MGNETKSGSARVVKPASEAITEGFRPPKPEFPPNIVLKEGEIPPAPKKTPSQRRNEIVTDASKYSSEWESIARDGTVKFNGKITSISDMMKHVASICELPTDMPLLLVRRHEVKIGNLMSQIYVEKSKAHWAMSALEHRKARIIGSSTNGKSVRSMSSLEAHLTANDEDYQALMSMMTDCRQVLNLWNDMYQMCLRTADRLKQISMALMAEMKLDPSDMGGRGDHIRGRTISG